MFSSHIDQRPTKKLGSPLPTRRGAERDKYGTDKVLAGGKHFSSHIVEQLSRPDQRILGIAALLGMEFSVHEVARVAEASPCEITTTFSRAMILGLLARQHNGRFNFVHERTREGTLATLEPTESLAAHARAAQLLTGPATTSALRRAHHALAAANRSLEDAVIAVRIVRETSRMLPANDEFEQAAALLGQAVELHDAAALPGPTAALVVEWAEAVLACGHLAEARPLFHRAACLAEAEGDSPTLARAALGLGGVWVREHRMTEEAERVGALQRRALVALPPAATVLRARLIVRLAAENVYRGGPLTPVIEGVAAARRTGDDQALAEALSLYHHALLTPEHTTSRLAVANELIAVASVAGARMLSLIGLCWRAADLFLLGDPSASVALGELRLRADALKCRSILFIVRAMEVMLAIRAGQFLHAEQAATVCYELGTEVGDADALVYYGAHVAAIRVFQGRETELADLAVSISTSPMLTERDRAFSLAAALFAVRSGDAHQARAALAGLKRDGLHSILPSSSWLLTLHAVVELAAELKDEHLAQAAYKALVPYAELPIMVSLAAVCFGSAHRPLGIAALTWGKIDLAIEHLSAAVAANEQLGHRPAAIQARADLALALLRRSGAGDNQRGQALIEEAMSEAETLGMMGLIPRWRKALAATKKRAVEAACHLVSVSSAPQGGWRITLGHHIATVPDLVGVRYLARLVAEPNRDIPALALVVDEGTPPPVKGGQEVIDIPTVTAVREQIRALRQQPVLTSEEQDELDILTHELARACGLGGRIRTFADVPERARTAVRKAMKRAIEQVTAANPAVGQHLAKRIKTGTVCCYEITSQVSD